MVLVTLTAGVFCLLLVPSPASAQQIGGTVTDTTGSVLPGVTVEARSPSLIEQVRTAVTDGRGQYLIVALEPGTYSVTYSLPGFSTIVRDGIQLRTGFTASIDVRLSVGDIQETVTVSGASPVVDIQNVEQRQVMDREHQLRGDGVRVLGELGRDRDGGRSDQYDSEGRRQPV